MKKHFFLALKFIFAGGIVAFLVRSGKLDFSLIRDQLKNPGLIALCLTMMTAQALLGTLRWRKLIASASKIDLPFFKMAKLTWIGLFFSSVLPGAVTGDLVKLVYARRLDHSLSKTFLIMSVLFDRILGLIGLLFLMGIFSLATYSNLTHRSPAIGHLINLNFLLFIGVIVFLIWMFAPRSWQEKFLTIANKVPLLGPRIHKTLESIWKFSKQSIVWGLLYSMAAQGLGVMSFWLITQAYYVEPISFAEAFTFIPLGLIAIAVPIAPAGLGIGHAIFDTLFGLFQIPKGASLFNLHFLIYVTVNLAGVIPYLLSTHRLDQKDMQEFESIKS